MATALLPIRESPMLEKTVLPIRESPMLEKQKAERVMQFALMDVIDAERAALYATRQAELRVRRQAAMADRRRAMWRARRQAVLLDRQHTEQVAHEKWELERWEWLVDSWAAKRWNQRAKVLRGK